MEIKNDYKYITDVQRKMFDLNLAKMDYHSLRIDGKNGTKSCIDIKHIIDKLDKQFLIYQYRKDAEGKYICNFNDEWDLLFWSNSNFGESALNCVRLSFNDEMEFEQRENVCKKLVSILSEIEAENIDITLQHKVCFDSDNTEKIKQRAAEKFEQIKDTFIFVNGKEGKIRQVPEYSDSYYGTKTEYGFFKKGSKKRYYQITNMDLIIL